MSGHKGRALVTGSSGGIGSAVAERLMDLGFDVVGFDLRVSLEHEIAVDITDAGLVDATIARLGGFDAVVTCAGHYEHVPLAELSADAWNKMLAVHLGGTVNVCRAAIPSMLDQGGGTIVTIASELALAGGDGECHYATAKGAIVGFTRQLAAELADRGIRACCVAPGPTDTPLLRADPRASEYAQTLPLGRFVRTREVAETVAFAVSEEGGLTSGRVLSPNGGAVI